MLTYNQKLAVLSFAKTFGKIRSTQLISSLFGFSSHFARTLYEDTITFNRLCDGQIVEKGFGGEIYLNTGDLFTLITPELLSRMDSVKRPRIELAVESLKQ